MKFTDNQKTTWNLALTVASIRRVKQEVGVDLTKLDGPVSDTDHTPLMTALGLDVELLVNVMFAVVSPQAAAAKITPEQFAERLDGQTVDAGVRGLWEAIANFTQPRRPDLATTIRKQATLIDQEAKKIASQVSALTSGNIASSLRALQGSTRKTKPSENSPGSPRASSKRSGHKSAV